MDFLIQNNKAKGIKSELGDLSVYNSFVAPWGPQSLLGKTSALKFWN